MKVNFQRLTWENYPSTETPINADNLNRLEEGVAGLYSDMAETEEKLSGGIGFVTPQMFGAKADNKTDDTQAIQDAINSGKDVVFPVGDYKTTSTITLSQIYNRTIDMSSAVINYDGSECALFITKSDNFELKIGYINAPYGDCINMFSNLPDNHVQYANIYFHKLKASGDCIKAENYDKGWINEIRIHDGQLEGGSNGVHLINHSTINAMDQWHFINVGCEGVTVGFYFETDDGCYIGEIFSLGTRYMESFTYLYRSNGSVTNLTHISPIRFLESYLLLSGYNSNWFIYSPILSGNNVAGDIGIIENNVLHLFQESYYKLNNTIPLSENANLNNIRTGRYSANDFAIAGTIMNSPITTPFDVISEYILGTKYIRQTLRSYNSNAIYTRVANIDNTIWSDWELLAKSTSWVTDSNYDYTISGNLLIIDVHSPITVSGWTTIGVLPSGYHPNKQIETSAVLGGSRDTVGSLRVFTNGTIQAYCKTSTSEVFGVIIAPI